MPLDYTTNLGWLDRLKNDLALAVRRRVFDLFMRECRPGPDDRVADFGATGHADHPVHVFFETLYPHPKTLTVIAREAEGARWFPPRFPRCPLPGGRSPVLPLPDGYFHTGLCNAVVEHSGTCAEQAALVREVCRVCQRVMFTTPNRWFPRRAAHVPAVRALAARRPLSRGVPPAWAHVLRRRRQPESARWKIVTRAVSRRPPQPALHDGAAFPRVEPCVLLHRAR